MDFFLINTLTGEKERIYAADGKALRFYACGPTVYGPAHIGNFRTFILQDVFRRTAEALGVPTFHVRNYTDVDDKTIRGARAAGQSLKAFTDHWRERFEADCLALNLLTPHVTPSAVENIPEQIDMIAQLVEKDLAYQAADETVYYRVEGFADYGKLSGLDRSQTVVNADGRLNSNDEYTKESVADFALWKAWKEEDGENRWDSPWGPGRPGWHIECSAMARKFLGDSFDLHSGGVDLIFPHHENEIAQSEGCTGEQMVRHWFHVAHLQIDGGKMSKSLGNLYTLDDVRERGFTPEELRYVLISGHYRQPLSFSWESLGAARAALKRLRAARELLGEADGAADATGFGDFEPALRALADDLNTPKAIGEIFSVVKKLEPGALEVSDATRHGFAVSMRALGLELAAPPESALDEAPENVKLLAQSRWEAKQARDFNTADQLRDELLGLGWRVKDAKDGFELSPK
ncbi:MAG: cysteine--tRNA ligase [Verrucomicrobiota bacterium]